MTRRLRGDQRRWALAWASLWLATLLTPLPSAEAAPRVRKGEEPDPQWTLNPYVGTWLGNERIIGEFGFLAPVAQRSDAMLFSDVRGRVDDAVSGEVNVGFGYRQIFGESAFMLGGYGYLDVLRSANANTFIQGTVGLEAFLENWSVRANGYIPESTERVLSTNGTLQEGPQIVDQSVVIVSGLGTEEVERALPGFDLEAGRRFDVPLGEFWVHGGYFYFGSDGFETIQGPRVRAAWDIDLHRFVPNTWLSLGGEWVYDDVRDHRGFGTIRLQYTFGGALARGASSAGPAPWTDRRMVSRIVRDVDVITGERERGEDQSLDPAINPATGEEFGEVIFIDGSGDGTGSESDPSGIDELAGRTNQGDEILIALDSAGDIAVGANGGITLEGSMRLIGGGTFLDVEDADGRTLRYQVPGGTPTLLRDSGSADAPSVSVRDSDGNIWIENLSFRDDPGFTGSMEALSIGGGSRASPSNDVTGTVDVRSVSFSDAKGRGIHVVGGGPDALFDFRDVEIVASQDTAVHFENFAGAAGFSSLMIDNRGSDGEGLVFEADAGVESELDVFGIESTIDVGKGRAFAAIAEDADLTMGFDRVTSAAAGTSANGVHIDGASGIWIANDGDFTGSTAEGVVVENSSAIVSFTTLKVRDAGGTAVRLTDNPDGNFVVVSNSEISFSGSATNGPQRALEATNVGQVALCFLCIDDPDQGIEFEFTISGAESADGAIRIVDAATAEIRNVVFSDLSATGSNAAAIVIEDVRGLSDLGSQTEEDATDILIDNAVLAGLNGASGIRITSQAGVAPDKRLKVGIFNTTIDGTVPAAMMTDPAVATSANGFSLDFEAGDDVALVDLDFRSNTLFGFTDAAVVLDVSGATTGVSPLEARNELLISDNDITGVAGDGVRATFGQGSRALFRMRKFDALRPEGNALLARDDTSIDLGAGTPDTGVEIAIDPGAETYLDLIVTDTKLSDWANGVRITGNAGATGRIAAELRRNDLTGANDSIRVDLPASLGSSPTDVAVTIADNDLAASGIAVVQTPGSGGQGLRLNLIGNDIGGQYTLTSDAGAPFELGCDITADPNCVGGTPLEALLSNANLVNGVDVSSGDLAVTGTVVVIDGDTANIPLPDP